MAYLKTGNASYEGYLMERNLTGISINRTETDQTGVDQVPLHVANYHKYPYIIMAGISFALAAFFFTSRLVQISKWGEEHLHLLHTERALEEKDISDDSEDEEGRLTGKKRVLKMCCVCLLVFMLFLQGGIQETFSAYIMMYACQGLHLSESSGYYLNDLFWGALLIGRCLMTVLGYFSDTIFLTPISLCFSVLIMGVLSFTSSTMPAIIWMSTAGFGLTNCVMLPNLILLMNDQMAFGSRIATLSVAAVCMGSFVLSAITGNVIVSFTMQTFPWCFLIYAGVLCGLFAALSYFRSSLTKPKA